MANFLIPKIKIIKYPLHLSLSLIQKFSFKIYTLNKDHQVKVSSSLHIKRIRRKFIKKYKKIQQKVLKSESKEKKKRKEKKYSKMKVCHQNKRITNHKQNCSHKVKKKERERKIKEEV